MCEYCESKNKNGRICSILATAYPKEEKHKGFRIMLQRNELFEIKDNHEVLSYDNRFRSYIKAYHWALGELEKADQISVEIQYCPICGEKL